MTHRSRLALLLACVAAAALGGTAQAAPLPYPRIEAALAAVHQYAQVALSPDGLHIASVESEGSGPGHVELAPVAHPTATRRVSACAGNGCDEGDLAWSPDGRTLAFVTTDATGQGQLALLDLATLRTHVLTHARGPLSTPRWSHDGTRIAFLYSPGAPKTPSPLNPATPDAGVVGAKIYEQRLAVMPARGGAIRLLGPADLNVYEYDWSPDDRRFAVSAAHGDGDANWWIADLYTIDARSGATKEIHHPTLQLASPRWNGDGTRIAYIGGIMSDEAVTGGDVEVVSARGGAATDVTPNLHASVTTITWHGSRDNIVATELAGSRSVIASIDTLARRQRALWSAEATIYATGFAGLAPGDAGVSLSRDGRLAATIVQSITAPPEIALGPLTAMRRVTHANDTVPRTTGAARSITWTSDGMHVQGWLIYPPGWKAGVRYPLVTLIHGGPAFANYPTYPSGPMAFQATLAARGYLVFEPNPRGSYGQGEAFTRANVKDFGYGDLRDVLAGLDAVAHVAPVDPKRVGIFGWSYGGYMTMWALTQTHRFHAAVAGAGLSDWLSYYGTNDIDTWMIPYFGASVYDDPGVYARSSPINFVKAVRTPTLMLHGDRDAEVPVTQSYEYWRALRAFHVPTELVIYPGEGHEFYRPADQRDVSRRIVGWFDRWLK
ncbi:MAG TPA: S9 family peptidase [Candidatus Sulfotelmatobacter sp.]|nr:S9 family peptidase [Candidatus Sulfotelmatobacter sp.]